MKSRMREVRSSKAAKAAARLALALALSSGACLFGGAEPEPGASASVAPASEAAAPAEEPPPRAEIEPEALETPAQEPAIGASTSDEPAAGEASTAEPSPGEASESTAPSDPAAPTDAPGSGAPQVPGPPRSIKVLQRVDENGVTHYVIQPASDSSGDAAGDRAPAGALAPVSSPPPESAGMATAQTPPTQSANEESEPSAIYSATADESATAAAARDLETRIRADREAIKNLISDPGESNPAEDPRLREIADRLPRLQAELSALRNERQP